MISYLEAKDKKKAFIALTGLEHSEFEHLLKYFAMAWESNIEEKMKQEPRKRKAGGGRKAILSTLEDKLFFILYYFKTYPLQQVIAFEFGMSQSQANEWIHRLTAILKESLSNGGYLPERNGEHLQKILSKSVQQEFAIDGSERRIQRPVDKEQQKECYSGKTKAHTVKNNIVADINEREVKYLSDTVEGKKHDKKIFDEQQISFPANSSVYKDGGFQGYEPEGTVTFQPKKKPKGGELNTGEKFINSIISSTRVIVEHVISGIKRCHIVKDIFRNTKEQFVDIVMEIACGLHNFRTRCRNANKQQFFTPSFL